MAHSEEMASAAYAGACSHLEEMASYTRLCGCVLPFRRNDIIHPLMRVRAPRAAYRPLSCFEYHAEQDWPESIPSPDFVSA